jgi:hypothetical protein
MDLTEREKRVRTFVEEVWNKRNYEAAHDLYADTYVNGFGTGSAARVEPIRRYHQAFPDSKVPRHRPGVRGLSTFRIALALLGLAFAVGYNLANFSAEPGDGRSPC